jgi:osmoprotectant transport system permease protein
MEPPPCCEGGVVAGRVWEIIQSDAFVRALGEHLRLSAWALLVAILIALALPFLGLGFRPALLALTVLAIPPILINAAIGLREVPPSVVESARGMGLSTGQILTRIRFPIAAPVIFAGLRTSAVQVVASATLATFIGGGGLGGLIVRGLQRNSPEFQLAGAIPVALLAIGTEVGFAALQRLATPKGLRITGRTRAA